MQEGDEVNPLANWTPEQGVNMQSADAQTKLAAIQKKMERDSKDESARADKQYDFSMRLEALKLANRSGTALSKDIVADARTFYKFLSGQDQTTL